MDPMLHIAPMAPITLMDPMDHLCLVTIIMIIAHMDLMTSMAHMAPMDLMDLMDQLVKEYSSVLMVIQHVLPGFVMESTIALIVQMNLDVSRELDVR